jgi:hypothetical protein
MVASRQYWRRLGYGAAGLVLVVYHFAFAFVHGRAVRRAQIWNVDCLMLTDVSDQQTWKTHRRLAVVFAPAYWIRSLLTGRPGPCVNEPLFELSAANSTQTGSDLPPPVVDAASVDSSRMMAASPTAAIAAPSSNRNNPGVAN